MITMEVKTKYGLFSRHDLKNLTDDKNYRNQKLKISE